jgi:biopolymer transport protein ExbD
MKTALITWCVLFVLVAPVVIAAGDDKPDIKRVRIDIFPNDVIVVKGEMVRMAGLREHLEALVAPAKRAAVHVVVAPQSRDELKPAIDVVRVARALGYGKVELLVPPREKPRITEIRILISKSGVLTVNDREVKPDELKAHLEGLVEADRRKDVQVIVNASRLVKVKDMLAVVKICREAGYTKTRLQAIPE